ncbi:DUF3429 domain-containing protein [Marinomonas sp. IMCC 4694]|uniref:DUF3429 domain-containing protein n=1 Tax=Marinomonas sp. IMCC 4694 TaxID=2605432 RepID=UPI001652DCD2|nr:DUF3429 domain-containing protein [Marinomonas sp. IMCC 4694]
MKPSYTFLTTLLGSLGVIPFATATYLNWQNETFLGWSGHELFSTYSAMILSFLSGALWGQLVHKQVSTFGKWLLLSTKLIALAAWLALLMHTTALAIALLLLGFMSIFWLEVRANTLIQPSHSHYFNMRFVITLVVCVLHLLMLYPHY